MVVKRIRSEYMKKFKDPKWETYSKCYEDLLKYRLSRRLLEQSHNPWFWGGWDTDSESSGKSTPKNKNNKVEPLKLIDKPPASGETPEPVITPKDAPEPEDQRVDPSASEASPGIGGPVPEAVEPCKRVEKGEEEKSREPPPAAPPEAELDACAQSKPKTRPRRSRKPTRAKTQPLKTKETDKENRHPFALYGWAEAQAEMASKKTHNVCPAASTKDIHESALRAKTRRSVEKQMKGVDRRHVQSADLAKMDKPKLVAEYDPWMTEYMRCFSARSR